MYFQSRKSPLVIRVARRLGKSGKGEKSGKFEVLGGKIREDSYVGSAHVGLRASHSFRENQPF